jgi:hypothetical protein
MSKRDLRDAAEAVRTLASEKGSISAREAHDAWRWVLVSRGWKAGETVDCRTGKHPNLVGFDALPVNDREHALELLNAVENDSDQSDESDFSPIKGCC